MKRTLRVVYILPSRYDDEGYVLRFWRGVLPSNSLACLQGLTRAIAETGELGEDVNVEVQSIDDTVEKVRVARIVRQAQRDNATLVVGLVGVQSNQFPRASDLALEFRAHHVPVMVGGFHVSGVLSIFESPTPELQRLLDAGITLVRGEVDGPGVLARLLRDALDGTLKPIYAITQSPDLRHAPIPRVEKAYRKRFVHRGNATLDTSRGCPFNCSFCTVINVQGRVMRCRSVETILASIESNCRAGISFYFFTDDNLARNPEWEALFDGLAALRQEGYDLRFMMQSDTQAWKIPRFLEKAEAAGCVYVFIGLETVNPDNIKAAGKAQNKVGEFSAMVEAWHRHNIVVHCGYIIGMPFDTRDSVRRDIAALKDDVKVDEATFFMLTPLPGSRDHLQMVRDGVPMDADLNRYDGFHETFRHKGLQHGQWTQAYREAWESFYSKENMVNVLLRVPRPRYWQLFSIFVWYRYCTLADTHPMVTGLVRLKERLARRPYMPREGVYRYAVRRLREVAAEFGTYFRVFLEFQEIWMLTRKPEDPRWTTLAYLRQSWSDARRRLGELELSGHCEEAARELGTLLAGIAEQLRALSALSGQSRRGTARKIRMLAQEVESYLKRIEMELPDWQTVRRTQDYVINRLVRGYEEVAIRYVAKRRLFSAYGHDFLRRLRSGRLMLRDVVRLPRAVLFEMVCALRFSVSYLANLS